MASAGLYASLHLMQTTMPTSHHSVFYRPDAIPDANQQHQSTEGKRQGRRKKKKKKAKENLSPEARVGRLIIIDKTLLVVANGTLSAWYSGVDIPGQSLRSECRLVGAFVVTHQERPTERSDPHYRHHQCRLFCTGAVPTGSRWVQLGPFLPMGSVTGVQAAER